MEESPFEPLDNIHNAVVLIIDSQADFSLLMQAYFVRKGCKAYTARTEVDALSTLNKITPDVVLIDRYICFDIDSFVDQIKALIPAARIIVQKPSEGKELTRNEQRMVERWIAHKPVPNNRYLTYIVILIVILAILQLILSAL